jgi:hypothetical protein
MGKGGNAKLKGKRKILLKNRKGTGFEELFIQKKNTGISWKWGTDFDVELCRLPRGGVGTVST